MSFEKEPNNIICLTVNILQSQLEKSGTYSHQAKQR